MFGIGFLLFGFTSTKIISTIKVNGNLYKEIIMQKDLVADILPPPEYIIEIHLTSFQLLNETDTSKINSLITYETNLESDFEKRHQVWVDQLPESQMKTDLVENSYNSATGYFKIFHDSFIPAIQKGDLYQANLILNSKLIPLYQEHRKYIDKIVEISNQNSTEIEASANNTIKNSVLLLVLLAVISMVVVIIFSLIIIRMITKPLSFLTKHLGIVATGDLSNTIPDRYLNCKDEIGMIAKATQNMQNSIKNIIQSVKQVTTTVNKAIIESNETINNLTTELDAVSKTSDTLCFHIQDVAASSEEISATTIEIEKSIEDISANANDGAFASDAISKRAILLKGNAKESQANIQNIREIITHSMANAMENSKQVEKIRGLSVAILEISSQTNLLALNASIEAARAGESGRGFAVVASEIGKLATNSNNTVTEIQSTVETVFEAVNTLVKASKDTIDFLDNQIINGYNELVQSNDSYSDDASSINGLVLTLSATSKELFSSVKTVSEAIENIANSTSEGANASSDIAKTISLIYSKANKVKEETILIKDSSEQLAQMIQEFTF